MLGDAPDFAFVLRHYFLEQILAHLACFLEQVKIFVFAGFLGGKEEVFLDRNQVHNSNRQIFVSRKVEFVVFFGVINLLNKLVDIIDHISLQMITNIIL